MREIFFRAKRIDNSEWVYGGYAHIYSNPNTDIIVTGRMCFYEYGDELTMEARNIDPSTLGQYTGLTDKNGKKIFEGDVIKIVPDYDYSDDYSISKVYSYNGIFCVDYHGDDFDSTALGFLKDYLPDGGFEVIGNIYDNPELLKGEQP